jgi:hypothetical protein
VRAQQARPARLHLRRRGGAPQDEGLHGVFWVDGPAASPPSQREKGGDASWSSRFVNPLLELGRQGRPAQSPTRGRRGSMRRAEQAPAMGTTEPSPNASEAPSAQRARSGRAGFGEWTCGRRTVGLSQRNPDERPASVEWRSGYTSRSRTGSAPSAVAAAVLPRMIGHGGPWAGSRGSAEGGSARTVGAALRLPLGTELASSHST